MSQPRNEVMICDRKIGTLIASLCALGLAACGSGDHDGTSPPPPAPASTAPAPTTAPTPAPTPAPAPATPALVSTFLDGPVAGLCYSASPSGMSGATSATGQYSYAAGDTVSFWLDGSGNGCAGTSPASSTSVALGTLQPSGTNTFVLSLNQGQQAADLLTALNVGSPTVMNVAGLTLSPSTVSALNTFVTSFGSSLPGSAAGSVDTFFNQIQAGVTVNTGKTPTFVTPVLANASTTTSVLENDVATELATTLQSVSSPTITFDVPSTGLLRFAVSNGTYTLPLSSSPTTVYSFTSATIQLYDGQGNLLRINSEPSTPVTLLNLADQSFVGTYTITPDTPDFSLTFSGTNIANGYTYTQVNANVLDYQDATNFLSTTTSTKAYTSGPNSGNVFNDSTATNSSTVLTPLTLAMLANKVITTGDVCATNSATEVLTFASDGSSFTSSCGTPTVTLTTQSVVVPGILLGTDSTGYIAYYALVGSGVAVGSYFITMLEAPGTGGNAGQGYWTFGQPITSISTAP